MTEEIEEYKEESIGKVPFKDTKMHWMRQFYIPINMDDVHFAHELLKNPLFEKPNINYAYPHDKNYIIKNVEVSGYTVKDTKDEKGYKDKGAVFFNIYEGLIKISKSHYPYIRFSVPKSNLIKYETDQIGIEQEIEITEWAYQNCYMFPINKIYEDWGRMMRGLIKGYTNDRWDEAPYYKYSSYKEIIEELHKEEIRKAIKNYKQKEEGKIIMENKNGDSTVGRKKHVQELFREEAEFIFYTDGSGNWADNVKSKAKAYFSVYLKNTQERWKKDHDQLTGNQAELLGVMGAISIAQQKKYKRVKIFTDSKNVVNWSNKKPNSDEYIWNANNLNIIDLVDRLREMAKTIPELSIEWISREHNYAHGI